MAQGRAAMWYDATAAGAFLENERTSRVAGRIGYVPAPVVKTKDSGWLWAWGLGVPRTSQHADAAQEFVSWATSKEYHRLVAQRLGWARVPPGTRQSTYQSPEYQQAARPFAGPALTAILRVNLRQPGTHPQPWAGVQYVPVPEFAELGTRISEEISAAIGGRQSVAEALRKAQSYAENTRLSVPPG
jgi:sorbitol/mannitol transport system substrate-binding protein